MEQKLSVVAIVPAWSRKEVTLVKVDGHEQLKQLLGEHGHHYNCFPNDHFLVYTPDQMIKITGVVSYNLRMGSYGNVVVSNKDSKELGLTDEDIKNLRVTYPGMAGPVSVKEYFASVIKLFLSRL